MNKTKVIICPYCGETQPAGERCRACAGLFEPLSRQATHNAMGPWFIRDERRPFQPGCSYEMLLRMVDRGQVTKYAIIRGPTTKQFWTVARRVPGIAHLLGYCHNCDASVDSDDHGCHACGVPFGAYLDRNFLGLPDVRPLPWEISGNDEPLRQAPASSGSVDFRRAAEPLGISSFASDAELRGQAAPTASPFEQAASMTGRPGSPQTGSGQSGEPQAQSAKPVSSFAPGTPQDWSAGRPDAAGRGGGATAIAPAPLVPARSASEHGGDMRPSVLLEASPAGAAARSIQRRLQRQQQTIRLMFIALVVLAAIAVAAVVASVSRGIGNANTPSGNASPPAVSGSSSKGAVEQLERPALDQDIGEAAGEPLEADHLRAPAVESSDLTRDIARARELLARAAEASRDRAARIADYEEAIALMKRIDVEAVAGERPEDWANQIQRAEKELERLKLEEYFP